MGWSGVRTLEIKFDRENGTYFPGELMTGKLLAEFAQPKKIRGIRITIVGEASVRWTVRRHKRRDVYRAREEYFSTRIYIIGNASGPTIELPTSLLTYPFNIQLPMDLPSSFEHQYGRIRYTVKATFDRPWKFDHEVKAAFTIASNYDLNQIPQASIPVQEVVNKTFASCCCMFSGKLCVLMSIPSTGFVPGQVIPITMKCENESAVEVENMKISLRKKLAFHSTFPSRRRKNDEITVIEERYSQPFSNKSDGCVMVQLRVPPLPPSELQHCSIINLNYVLKVVLSFSGLHCSLKHYLPILIGTVPLYSTYNMYNPDAITMMPSPSAPLLPQGLNTNTSFPGLPQPGGMPYPSSNQIDPRNLPPPSYEECMYGTQNIKDDEESDQVQGIGVPFAPRYPVYHYGPT